MRFARAWVGKRVVGRALGGLLLAAAGCAPCWAVDLGRTFEFDIPDEPLGPALLLFSQQAGIQIAMPGADLGDLHFSGIKGAMSVRDALGHLLSGTGLSYQVTGETSVVIGRFPSAPAVAR